MKYHIYSFENLDVYKSALRLSIEIRVIIKRFPTEENFGLKSQMRRAADSISANIAEGSGRASSLDKAHFTNMPYSSALEIVNHLNLSIQLDYITEEQHQNLRLQLDKIINQLNALYKYQINNTNNLKQKLKENNK